MDHSMLKRSLSVTPAILGSLMSLTLLTGCIDEDVDAAVYSNISQCAKGGVYTKTQCVQYSQQAQEAHRDAAPKYEKKSDCEVEFGKGKCGPGPQIEVEGFSTFQPTYIPYAAGFMIGAAASQPLYRLYQKQHKAYGPYTTSGGLAISRSQGRTMVKRSILTTPPAHTTKTTLRGGFGILSRTVSGNRAVSG